MITSAAKQKYRSLEATVTKSQQVIILLKMCVVLFYFSNISCFIRLHPWERKSAVYEIAIPAAFAKCFDIHFFYRNTYYFLKTLETFRVVKPPSPTRETTKRNMLGVGHQTAIILDIAYYVLDINLYVVPEYTDSKLVTCFILQRFFYLWEGLVYWKKLYFSGLLHLNKISLKNNLFKRCNYQVYEKHWEDSELV